jgi:hypothetical protein
MPLFAINADSLGELKVVIQNAGKTGMQAQGRGCLAAITLIRDEAIRRVPRFVVEGPNAKLLRSKKGFRMNQKQILRQARRGGVVIATLSSQAPGNKIESGQLPPKTPVAITEAKRGVATLGLWLAAIGGLRPNAHAQWVLLKGMEARPWVIPASLAVEERAKDAYAEEVYATIERAMQ